MCTKYHIWFFIKIVGRCFSVVVFLSVEIHILEVSLMQGVISVYFFLVQWFNLFHSYQELFER